MERVGMGKTQRRFTGGELTPKVHGQTDYPRYADSLARGDNWFARLHGGLCTRGGTRWLGYTKDQALPVRLRRFVFSTVQAYILEIGDGYIRVHKDRGTVVEAAKTITGATQATPCVVTSASHGYTAGDTVYIANVAGMVELNGRWFRVGTVATNTYALLDPVTGANIASGSYGAYTSGGTSERAYTIASPYAAADLTTLRFTQSADVLTITAPGYARRQLTRTGHTSWTLTTPTVGPTITAPTGQSAATNDTSAPTKTYNYKVTALQDGTLEETLPSVAATIVSTDLRRPLNTFSSTRQEVTVSWSATAGCSRYNVYKDNGGGLFGYIGSATNTSFVDDNIAPDISKTPPTARDPFASSNFATACEYYEQRLILGGTVTYPQQLELSKSGLFNNFDQSIPLRDSDSFSYGIAARSVQDIRHIVALSNLVLLTGTGEWFIDTGDNPLTPTTMAARPLSYHGSTETAPLVVRDALLWDSATDTGVRELRLENGGYVGRDISVAADHLFLERDLVSWCFAGRPHSAIYASFDDGSAVVGVYAPEQDVVAWFPLVTDGTVEWVESCPESQEDVPYMVVRRTIGGVSKRFIEYLPDRDFDDVRDYLGLDCAISYDDPITVSGVSTGITTILTATAHGLVDGEEVELTGVLGLIEDGEDALSDALDSYPGIVGSATTNTFELLDRLGNSVDTAGLTYRSGGTVRRLADEISGLWHLEGHDVQVVADASPQTDETVVRGKVTSSRAGGRVHVGIGYQCTARTLPADDESGEMRTAIKVTARADLVLRETVGGKVGASLERMRDIKARSTDDSARVQQLNDGEVQVAIGGSLARDGGLYLVQDQPLPMEVLSLHTDFGED
jgi:hypothetical protein